MSMKEYPIQVEPHVDAKQVEIAVEKCSRDLGLLNTMRGTLAKYPGCVHWHFRKPLVNGTLEVTSWPSNKRLWISVQQAGVLNGWKRLCRPWSDVCRMHSEA
jgi:hypothetical protein